MVAETFGLVTGTLRLAAKSLESAAWTLGLAAGASGLAAGTLRLAAGISGQYEHTVNQHGGQATSKDVTKGKVWGSLRPR